MTADPTLYARLILSGAAVELPNVVHTRFAPRWGGYGVEMELSDGRVLTQWCAPDDLNIAVEMMVTLAWAFQGEQDAA